MEERLRRQRECSWWMDVSASTFDATSPSKFIIRPIRWWYYINRPRIWKRDELVTRPAKRMSFSFGLSTNHLPFYWNAGDIYRDEEHTYIDQQPCISEWWHSAGTEPLAAMPIDDSVGKGWEKINAKIKIEKMARVRRLCIRPTTILHHIAQANVSRL